MRFKTSSSSMCAMRDSSSFRCSVSYDFKNGESLQLSWDANRKGLPLPFPEHSSAQKYPEALARTTGSQGCPTGGQDTWHPEDPPDTGGSSSSTQLPPLPPPPPPPVDVNASATPSALQVMQTPLQANAQAMQYYQAGLLQSAGYLLQICMQGVAAKAPPALPPVPQEDPRRRRSPSTSSHEADEGGSSESLEEEEDADEAEESESDSTPIPRKVHMCKIPAFIVHMLHEARPHKP